MWKNKTLNLVITTFMVLSAVFFITFDESEASNGTTLYVGGSGPGNYTTIRSAINDANTGDTIFVFNGTYYENVTLNKSINLMGKDKKNTIIDGGGIEDFVVYISAHWVNVSRFTIRNSGTNGGKGIRISSKSNTISQNILTNNGDGIYVASSNNMITENIIKNNSNFGISLSSSNNIISKNNIYNNNESYGGIWIWKDCNNNVISENFISENNDAISIWVSSNNTITGNIIQTVNDTGIALQHLSNYNAISYNIIRNNRDGIVIGYGDFPSNGNLIYNNNFLNNTRHAYDECNNTWDNGYPSGGNYWSDNDRWDALHGPNQDIGGGDGISDTPYNISGDGNNDRYPFMHPYSPFSNVYFQGLEPLYTTEHIEIAITITPKEEIAGAQLDFLFDPDMLSIEWVAEGNLFSEYDTYFDPGIIDNTNGSLKNVVLLITTPGGSANDQGSIAVMSIRAKTVPGETSLNLSNVIIGRQDGTPIAVTLIKTIVTIYPHDRWDVNWDNKVNILDLILIAQWWSETGSPCWVSADVNCDGAINILDMVLVGQHWTG